jgi:hypothetical protein
MAAMISIASPSVAGSPTGPASACAAAAGARAASIANANNSEIIRLFIVENLHVFLLQSSLSSSLNAIMKKRLGCGQTVASIDVAFEVAMMSAVVVVQDRHSATTLL